MFDIFASSYKNIFRKKTRSFLTILGISIGILSVIIISLIGEIGKKSINNELNSLGIDGIAFRTEGDSLQTLSESDLSRIRNMNNVKYATPLNSLYSQVMVKNTELRSIIFGVDATVNNVVALDIIYGRLIRQSDIDQNKRVCIVDRNFAINSYNRENIVGKTVKIQIDNRYQEFKVIGVVATGGNMMQQLMGGVVPTFIYVPITTMQIYLGSTEITQIAANFIDDTKQESTVNSIINTISEGKKVVAEDLNKQKANLNGVLNSITLVLSIIASISLIVAGLSVMTVMLVTVTERTKEIGIKKSIGASNGRILLEFLVESLLLSLIGVTIGTVVAVSIVYLGCLWINVEFVASIKLIAVPLVITMLSGILFGIFPAIKASKLCPVKALSQ